VLLVFLLSSFHSDSRDDCVQAAAYLERKKEEKGSENRDLE